MDRSGIWYAKASFSVTNYTSISICLGTLVVLECGLGLQSKLESSFAGLTLAYQGLELGHSKIESLFKSKHCLFHC